MYRVIVVLHVQITKFHSDAVDGHVTLARFIKKKGIRRLMVLRAVG